MKLFFSYLRDKAFAISVYLLCAAVLTAAFALYNLPFATLIYPAVLCLVILLIAVGIDFSGYRSRHIRLCTLSKCAVEISLDNLPDKLSFERDYNMLICRLCEAKRENETLSSARFAEISEYYTTWVHQIKTPIASMKLMLEAEDSSISRNLSNELFRIEQYVEMVLTYIRLGSESTDYVIKNQPLDPIVRSTVKKFAGQFIHKGLTLKYSMISEQVLTDSKWLSFVIEQIISNSVKYTAHGSVCIDIEKSDDCRKITLRISDTGIGIAAAELPRIFEKSYTGSAGRSDIHATGIGLYLCKQICDRLGHTLRVRSKPGEGTEVFIDFDTLRHSYE